jgi:penicillin amidase
MQTTRETLLRRAARASFRAFAGSRRPTVAGRLDVTGIRGAVRIARDRHGVPFIEASNEADAWFGLGFCQGQDRALQLEILVRTARGTLAEAVGRDGVAVDRLVRRLGVRSAAAAQLTVARPEVKLQLDAYARGIATGATRGMEKKSADLALLGVEPTAWEAVDVQAINVLLCFALASNWDLELIRFEVARRDGPDAVRAVDVRYPADAPTAMKTAEAFGVSVEHLAGDLAALSSWLPFGGGSNAWAVAPSRTTTGAPLLVADPHLDPAAPPHWYLAHVEAPGLSVSGACFVGVPAVAIGHNGFAAWAVTAAHADNTDLYLEEIGPDRRSLRRGDAFEPCTARTERIEVKGAAPVEIEVLEGPRGPLVGDAFDGTEGLGTRFGLSLSATWLAPRPYTGLLRSHTLRSPEAFHAFFREGSTSSVGAVYADAAGHIALRCAVEAPVRRRGFGTMPRPGWALGEGWEGLVPFEAMPFVTDPADGFVVAANQAPLPEGAGPWLGADFLDGYRASRIAGELGAHAAWDRASSQTLQKDVRTLAWDAAKPAVLAVDPSGDGDVATALAWLRTWDGRMASSSTAATIWACSVASLAERIVRRWAPKSAARVLGVGFHMVLPHTTVVTRRTAQVVELLATQPDGWFEHGWPAEIRAALGHAVRRLARLHGGDPAAWRWGRARPLRLAHPLGKGAAPLDAVFGIGPLEGQGDATTIVQGTVDLLDPLANPVGVPNLRAFIDLARPSESRFALLGGQSGDPCSAHYEDLIEPWRTEGIAIATTIEACRASEVHVLDLAPG